MTDSCVVCSAQTTVPFTVKNKFEIVRCTGCGLLRVVNIPSNLSDFYVEGYFTGDVTLDGYMNYEADKEAAKASYVNHLEHLKLYNNNSTGTLFEVGCATGFFLQLAKDRQWSVSGVDISEYAVREAKKKGLAVEAGTLEMYVEKNPGATFDCVAMFDVIEHVADPAAMAALCCSMLRPEGLMILATPDAGSLWARVWGKRWHAIVPPQHLYYFTVKNMVQLLEQKGFQIIYTGHHGKKFTVPYILRLCYTWTKLSVFSYLAQFAARTFLKNLAIPLNVRDTMTIIAKKSTPDVK